MATFILITVALMFVLAYRIYGRWLERVWRVDAARTTPAHTQRDGQDYEPAKLPIVFGHHFASIAGAAPIIGPIAASIFGWAPVLIWIVAAGIFFGAVHDFGALFTSIRHGSANLSEVIGRNTAPILQTLFGWFVWLTSVLVIAAFTSIVGDTFVKMPSAATASIAFMAVALVFSLLLYKLKLHIVPATLIALTLMIGGIMLGHAVPIVLPKAVWMLIIIGYIAVSSVTPIWILLQPRDYLNAFLLYALVLLSLGGVAFANPDLHLPMFTAFSVNDLQLFPMLFVMVACGAISGYHSMFASTTTSKQVNNERDIRPIAYGGMLVESLLAVIALLVAASLTAGRFGELYQTGGPIAIFSMGLGGIADQLGLPVAGVQAFVVLTISSFALTSLDSVSRVARSIMQNVGQGKSADRFNLRFLSNKYAAMVVTVGAGGAAAFTNWQIIWPIFGCANQLIAVLALVIVFIWLKKTERPFKMILLPMVFMFLVTTVGLIRLTLTSVGDGNFFLAGFSAALLSVAVLFVIKSLPFFTPVENEERAL